MLHLDTSIVVAYLRGNANVTRTLPIHIGDLAISAIGLAELRFGASVSARPEKISTALTSFQVSSI